jgi:hypothetical protein
MLETVLQLWGTDINTEQDTQRAHNVTITHAHVMTVGVEKQ